MTSKPKQHEKTIPSRTGLCRSPRAGSGAGSRRVLPENRMGRPLALSTGSLRAAAAQGGPAIGSPGHLSAAETSREDGSPGAVATAATGAAARILTPAADNAGCAASAAAHYSGSLAGARDAAEAGRARDLTTHHRGGQLHERLLGECRRQQRPIAALPQFRLRSCCRLLWEAGHPRKHPQGEIKFHPPLADPPDLVAARRGRSKDLLR